MIIIYKSNRNSCRSETEITDKQKLLVYYKKLEKSINAFQNQIDLLIVTCKLFVKITIFVKDLNMQDSKNF
jgi:hypothetical protein